jgi:hypothetical protein
MNAMGHTAQAQKPATSSKALASLLLGAGVAALVVMADQLMEPWAESHVIAAWIALWAVAVVAIAALRGLSRHLAQQVMHGLDGWSAGVAQRRSDRRLWAMAQTDSRMMSDLQAAFDREDNEDLSVQDVVALSHRRAARIVRNRLHYI